MSQGDTDDSGSGIEYMSAETITGESSPPNEEKYDMDFESPTDQKSSFGDSLQTAGHSMKVILSGLGKAVFMLVATMATFWGVGILPEELIVRAVTIVLGLVGG